MNKLSPPQGAATRLKTQKPVRLKRLYSKFGGLLTRRMPTLRRTTPRQEAMRRVRTMLETELGYRFRDVDVERPWGGYFRIRDDQIDKFMGDFFPGLNKETAQLGIAGAEISPKIMVFLPGQRISWQWHERRTERWHFLTSGLYHRSKNNRLPAPTRARKGEIVQFDIHERHRGGAPTSNYVLVAEIWQHTDPSHLSDEDDVIRLEDDYGRPKHPKQS